MTEAKEETFEPTAAQASAAFAGLAHFGPATAAKIATELGKIDVVGTHPDKAAERVQAALAKVTAATSKAHLEQAKKAGEAPGGTATVNIGHGQALVVVDRLRAAAGS